MKLFISYSRDDKAWVYELWRALRDEAFHDSWIDRRLVPAQDWWNTILENVETCECCIYVMTPKSVESIFCRAEVGYALALNKPVLPLMLKPCDSPSELGRFQYQSVTDDMNLDKVLFKVTQGLNQVEIKLLKGQFTPRTVGRPSVPTPQRKTEQVSEVFTLAEEAASENNFSLAESLFEQVMNADPGGWGLAAAERLAEIRFERERDRHYLSLVQMAKNPALAKGARAAVKVYVGKYGIDHDPENILSGLQYQQISPSEPDNEDSFDIKGPMRDMDLVASTPTTSSENLLDIKGLIEDLHLDPAVTPISSVASTPSDVPNTAHKPPTSTSDRKSSLDILRRLFAWIDIPTGKVKLVEGGYIPKRGQTFDVPAFKIARYPTSNAEFAKFVMAGGYGERRWWTDEGWAETEKNGWSEPRYRNDDKFNGNDYPVVGVSWYEAVAFCLWLSDQTEEKIMLPTEQQWQRAAQGDKNWAYPWGDEFDMSRCNFNTKGTTSVTQFQGKGDSPFKVVDMSGNVWEWCSIKYDTGGNELGGTGVRVLRGGSWRSSNENYLRADFRNGKIPPIGTMKWDFALSALKYGILRV